ncbi:MAG: nickel pincer cofactor biosynthesis protein LarC [Spirochaetes bacterium]|jgi:hypothetical protein|nr:nickel pincer cofactor biosynthesis protein LarC [Spirochaetota bacterium]
MMNKKIIFDIQFGASGDMMLGAMIDLGLDVNELLSELKKLDLGHWEISPKKTVKYHMSGTLSNVKCGHDHHSRNINDIKKIILESGLGDKIQDNIINVFEKLGRAEASVHGTTIEEIHFHEIGAIDSIIDISAFCIGLEMLGIDGILFNDFWFGRGSVKTAHGEIPVPVPAVVELTRGYRAVTTERSGENITPTAAALLTTLGSQLSENTGFTLIKTGIGFGTRNYPYPSYTRAMLIETEDGRETVIQLECNIDDMNPQVYPHLIEKLLEHGALDAYFSQISMKKGRTGSLLTVIAPGEKAGDIKETIYRNTTTLGLRSINIRREKLYRDFVRIKISGDEIRIKVGYLNGEIVNIQPEYEDCREVSEKTGMPLKEVMSRAVSAYLAKK